MNADGHLRSAFFGRSQTMTIKDSGFVINTLHKFTNEEKSYDVHYDL